MGNKKNASQAYRQQMTKLVDKVDKILTTVAANTISEMMLQAADDYEEIYQKCVMKFYSIRAPRKYIRHGMGRAGIKKGINLYRATISKIEESIWRGNKIISSIETERGLYENSGAYDTSEMMGYVSLSKKHSGPVDPYVIVSNMMNGIRYPSMPGRFTGKKWSTGKLTVTTSIGNISYTGSPISLLNYYDEEWKRTFFERFKISFEQNLGQII